MSYRSTRDQIFGYTRLPRTSSDVRAGAGARATGALSGLVGVVLGAWCPPPPGAGGVVVALGGAESVRGVLNSSSSAPTMLNGGGDTSITISGTRLSNLNSIAGRQTRDELRRHCDAILENYAALALAHPPHRFLCSLAARD